MISSVGNRRARLLSEHDIAVAGYRHEETRRRYPLRFSSNGSAERAERQRQLRPAARTEQPYLSSVAGERTSAATDLPETVSAEPEVGLWEVCRTGTDNALGPSNRAGLECSVKTLQRDLGTQAPEWIAPDKLQTSRCRWSRLGPNGPFSCESLSNVLHH